jgi:anti-sigma-K factor RskA
MSEENSTSFVDPDACAANAAAYVLGALTDEEHETFSLHVDSCAVCRREVAALRGVADALPAAAPRLSAPPELKDRIMAGVAGAREQGRNGPERARRRSPFGWPVTPAAFGAVALALVLVALAVVLLARGGASATRVIRAEVLAHGATATLRVSSGHAELDISGMPQTGPQRVYELWITRSGAPQPTDALFTVTSSGGASVGVPGSVEGVKVIMVTSEPLGGTRVPTTAPLIIARI